MNETKRPFRRLLMPDLMQTANVINIDDTNRRTVLFYLYRQTCTGTDKDTDRHRQTGKCLTWSSYTFVVPAPGSIVQRNKNVHWAVEHWFLVVKRMTDNMGFVFEHFHPCNIFCHFFFLSFYFCFCLWPCMRLQNCSRQLVQRPFLKIRNNHFIAVEDTYKFIEYKSGFSLHSRLGWTNLIRCNENQTMNHPIWTNGFFESDGELSK